MDYKDRPTCSDECAFTTYKNELPRLGPEKGVQLANEDNVSVGIYRSEGSEGVGISIAYRHIDAGAWSSKDEMAPEVRGMYDRIKADLSHQGIQFIEVSESVV
jgi:hypothetical protein